MTHISRNALLWMALGGGIATIASLALGFGLPTAAGPERLAQSESGATIVLGSGLTRGEQRDFQNVLIECSGPACPATPLPAAAFVVRTHHSYAVPFPGTQYIAQVANGTSLASPGYACCTTAVFENSFDLPPDAVSATISMASFADNDVIAAINGQEVARHNDVLSPSNYAGPPTTICTAFTPHPSGTNRLRVTLGDGGGALGLDYRATVRYDVGSFDPATACTDALIASDLDGPIAETWRYLVAAATAASKIPRQSVRTVKQLIKVDP